MNIAELQSEIATQQSLKKILDLRETAISRKIEALKAELQLECGRENHSGFITEESSYYSGNYDERASTTYWNKCTRCGATSESHTKTHSYYG